MLSDPAELPAHHVGLADRVQQQRLAVVDVAHDRDDGRTGDQARLVHGLRVLFGFEVVLLLRAHDLDALALLRGSQLDRIV